MNRFVYCLFDRKDLKEILPSGSLRLPPADFVGAQDPLGNSRPGAPAFFEIHAQGPAIGRGSRDGDGEVLLVGDRGGPPRVQPGPTMVVRE